MSKLGIPLHKVEKMSFGEIDKWAAVATWIVTEIDQAPYRTKK